ncbi:MAG: SurA N-terminal domain-containing protein [Alphaproteobacteria bacterium]|nr:SurA N-terminal domain-containing protein [Alphaproteobacteria bacterium]
MLQSLRSKATSWVIKLLFVLLIVSFAIWGIGDIFRGPGQQTSVAQVGDVEISAAELNGEFRRQVDRLRPLFGGQFDADKARQLGVLDQSLDMLVGQALLQQEIKHLGIAVPESVIRQRIAQIPAFRNEAGLFDPQRFQAALRSNNLTEAGLVANLRQDLSRDQLAGTIAATVRTPATLADIVYRHRREQRVADYVVVEAARTPEPPAADEAELKAYLEQHKDRFSTPEYRAFEMVRIDPAAVIASFKPDDARVKEAYELRQAEFQHPERREVLQMALDDEAKVTQALRELELGKDFLAVAKEVAGHGEDVVKLGGVTRRELLPELAEPAFALAAGKTSEAIKTPFGWNIVKVEKIEPARTETLEEARPKLVAELAREAAGDAVTRLANKFEDERAGGGSFEEAAQRAGLSAVKVAAMDRDGRGPDGKPVEGLPPGGEAAKLAFETAVNADSPMTDTQDGGMVAIHVVSSTPPAVKPFEQVREQLAKAIEQDRRTKAAQQAAEAIRDKVKSGTALAEAAGQGAEIKTTPAFTREEGTPFGRPAQSLVAELFKLKPGEAALSPVAGGFVVAQLRTVTAADPAADAAGVARIADQLRQSIGTDIYAQFNNGLRGRFGVAVHQSVIDRMFK